MVNELRQWSAKRMPSQAKEDSDKDSGSDVEGSSFDGVEVDHHHNHLHPKLSQKVSPHQWYSCLTIVVDGKVLPSAFDPDIRIFGHVTDRGHLLSIPGYTSYSEKTSLRNNSRRAFVSGQSGELALYPVGDVLRNRCFSRTFSNV